MKTFINKVKSVIVGIMLFVAAVFSSFANTAAEQRHENRQFCSQISSIAGVIMHQRQQGASLSLTLDHFDRLTRDKPDIRNLINSIVMQAYRVPQYSTAESRNREVREFENLQMLACMTAFENRAARGR